MFDDFDSYDIIETVRTGGFDYMKEGTIYLLVDKVKGEQFKKNITANKSCLDLIYSECKDKHAGLGLYTIIDETYIKTVSLQDKLTIIGIDIKYKYHISLCNVYKENEINALKEYEKQMREKGLPYETIKDFINSLAQITNVNPDLFKIPYTESLSLVCRSITKYIGPACFIKKNDIQEVVRACKIIQIK